MWQENYYFMAIGTHVTRKTLFKFHFSIVRWLYPFKQKMLQVACMVQTANYAHSFDLMWTISINLRSQPLAFNIVANLPFFSQPNPSITHHTLSLPPPTRTPGWISTHLNLPHPTVILGMKTQNSNASGAIKVWGPKINELTDVVRLIFLHNYRCQWDLSILPHQTCTHDCHASSSLPFR